MEKTYVFDTAESGGLNSSALIASLMQNKGVDPNLMAMLTNASKNQDTLAMISNSPLLLSTKHQV